MDLTILTPEQLQALKHQLEGLNADGTRTPERVRQLDNLLLLPTAKDARPTWFYSPGADDVRHMQGHKTFPYPRLLWHGDTGVEITVKDAAAHQAKLSQGYVETQPSQRVADPVMDIRDMLDGLSEAEQAAILDGQQAQRRAELQARIAALPAAQLERLLAASEPQADAPRKPGRPRKVSAA